MSTHGSIAQDPPPVPEDDSETQKRVRKLTEKGSELYETKKSKLKTKLIESWDKVQRFITSNTSDLSEETPNINSEIIAKLRRDINGLYADFLLVYEEIADFLLRTNTTDSQKEYEMILSHSESNRKEVDKFRAKLNLIDEKLRALEKRDTDNQTPEHVKRQDDIKPEIREAPSDISSSTKLSKTLILKQAEAEAARVKLRYAEKQAALLKQQALFEENEQIQEAARKRNKANFEADMGFLTCQMELEACIAQANVLEMKSENGSVKVKLNLPEDDPMKRVENFVNEYPKSVKEQVETENYMKTPEPLIEKQDPPYAPCVNHDIQQSKVDHSPSQADDLVKFLLRKDLTLSRIYTFNDKPENYRTWKCSFTEVKTEMNVSPSEEMDLLVKYLGVESKKYALSIRTANAHNPEKGLQRIWERLEERYGSAEMVHSAVLKKLQNFPVRPKRVFQIVRVVRYSQ